MSSFGIDCLYKIDCINQLITLSVIPTIGPNFIFVNFYKILLGLTSFARDFLLSALCLGLSVCLSLTPSLPSVSLSLCLFLSINIPIRNSVPLMGRLIFCWTLTFIFLDCFLLRINARMLGTNWRTWKRFGPSLSWTCRTRRRR
jgi:hypothetical protein